MLSVPEIGAAGASAGGWAEEGSLAAVRLCPAHPTPVLDAAAAATIRSERGSWIIGALVPGLSRLYLA